jgi:pimeloyl-ACP methyl ester carboxylesterase
MELTWAVFERSRKHFDQIINEGLMARLGNRASTMERDLLDVMISKLADRIGPMGFLTLFGEFAASGDVALADIRIPALVLAGAADPGLGSYRAELFAGEFAAAQVVLEPDYHHFCHVQHAVDVATHLTRFANGTSAIAPTDQPGRTREETV